MARAERRPQARHDYSRAARVGGVIARVEKEKYDVMCERAREWPEQSVSVPSSGQARCFQQDIADDDKYTYITEEVRRGRAEGRRGVGAGRRRVCETTTTTTTRSLREPIVSLEK